MRITRSVRSTPSKSDTRRTCSVVCREKLVHPEEAIARPDLHGAVHPREEIESELMSERCADGAPDSRVGDVLRGALDLKGRDAAKVDRADLVGENEPVLRLTRVPGGDRDLPGILRRSGRDRTHRREPRPMERFIGHNDSAMAAALIVSDGGIEVDDDDPPAKRPRGHRGQRSCSSKPAAISRTSSRNSGSAAADSQTRASSSSRSVRSSPSTAESTTASCELPYRAASSRTLRRVSGRRL